MVSRLPDAEDEDRAFLEIYIETCAQHRVSHIELDFPAYGVAITCKTNRRGLERIFKDFQKATAALKKALENS